MRTRPINRRVVRRQVRRIIRRRGGCFAVSFFFLCFTAVCINIAACPETSAKGAEQTKTSSQERKKDTLKVGDDAPLFTLKSLDGKSDVHLADFEDVKAVVLIFGSYT